MTLIGDKHDDDKTGVRNDSRKEEFLTGFARAGQCAQIRKRHLVRDDLNLIIQQSLHEKKSLGRTVKFNINYKIFLERSRHYC